MSNKIKKLICSLLAATMVVSSASMLVFADGEDTAASDPAATTETAEGAEAEATAEPDADATEAPDAEETAAPEATEAPAATAAPTGTSYDSDNYYQKSLALCSSLGVISGFEDGSVKPDEKVTRAQMASIVLRLLNLGASTYQNIFTDVDGGHWAAGQIQAAYEGGIVNGMGDGTFAPDAQVTYAQVIVMLVNALNFKTDAEMAGGWQQGYIKIAGEKDILKNAQSSADEPADRGLVIKMVYNTLLADYNRASSFENGSVQYTADRTLAEEKFDVIEGKGTLLGTAKTSLRGDMQEGTILIRPDKEENDVTYDTNLTGLEDYLAQKVTYYYKETTGLAPEVVAVTYDEKNSEVYTIDDLDDIENVDVDGTSVSYKLNKVSKAKKTIDDPTIVFNGKLLDPTTLESGDSLETLAKPEQGTIRLVKSDKKSDDYDTLFIESYETIVVSSATDTKLIGKVQKKDGKVGETEPITYSLDDTKDRTITAKKGGEEVRLRNLKKNDVACVKASYPTKNPEVIDVIVTGESITGSASGMSVKFDKSYATINGEKYDVANVAAGDLQTGVQCTFYLDMFGKIGYVEGTSGSRLQSGEKYGWLIEGFKADDGSSYMIKMITQDGKEESYKLASNVDFWAPNALVGDEDAGVTLKQADAQAKIADIVKNGGEGYAHMWSSVRNGSAGQLSDGSKPYAWSKANPIQLIKYKTNSSGKITRLYFAVNTGNAESYYYDASDPHVDGGKNITDPYVSSEDIDKLNNSDALLFSMIGNSGKLLVGGMVAGYVITDGIPEFGVPNNPDDYGDAAAYSVKPVVAAQYNQRENGLADTWLVVDPDGTAPGAIIRFVPNATKPVNPADIDNVGGPSPMVVDTIDVGVDNDDQTIYTINGYVAGGETSVQTNSTSALGVLEGWDSTAKKYTLSDEGTIWDANSSDPLSKYIHKGDIIITDGTYILIYVHAEDVYETLKADPTALASKYVSTTDTRNYFWFDRVTDSDIGDTPWMKIGGNVLSADASASFDVVEIDLAAKDAESAITISDEMASIADVYSYSEGVDEYDYAFARFANKGGFQGAIIYRIKNAD